MRAPLAILALTAALAGCSGGEEGMPPDVDGEPNDTLAQATQLTIGTPVAGTISSESDVDFYTFTVPSGGATVRFQTFDESGVACDPVDWGVDPFLQVYDGNGVSLGPLGFFNDDGLGPWCEDGSIALAEGVNYVEVGGSAPFPFVYTLKVTIP